MVLKQIVYDDCKSIPTNCTQLSIGIDHSCSRIDNGLEFKNLSFLSIGS